MALELGLEVREGEGLEPKVPVREALGEPDSEGLALRDGVDEPVGFGLRVTLGDSLGLPE